jgi:hypothetical protein
LKPDNPYMIHMSRLKRIFITKIVKRFFLSALLFFFPLASIVLVFDKWGWVQWHRYEILGFILALSLLLALLRVLRRRQRFADELMDIDARLALKSRLSTAYEYHRSNRKTLFADLLINDVCRLLQTIGPKKMFPRIPIRNHLLVSGFIILFLLVLFSNIIPYPLTKKGTEDPELLSASVKIRDFIKQESRIPKNQKSSKNEITRNLEDIVNRLDEKTMDRGAFVKSVQTMGREVMAEQASIARRIRATLNPGDIENTPELRPFEDTNFQNDELERMMDVLKELFQGDIPESIMSEMEHLERNSRLGHFLDEIIADLQADRALEIVPMTVVEKKGAFMDNTIPKEEKEAADSSAMHARMGPQTTYMNRSVSPIMGRGGADSSDLEARDRGSGEPNPAAGDVRATGKQKTPYRLESSKGAKIREKGISMKGERYSAQVRSLAMIGTAEMSETEILKTYAKQIEDILQKEDIPLNYREYIKNYFLHIGIGKDEKIHDDDD